MLYLRCRRFQKIPKPNPGSVGAKLMSCQCPKEDNDNGKGAIGYPEDYFWIDDTCNLHNVANIKTDGLYLNPKLSF